MQQIGVIALFGGWRAERFETIIRIIERIKTCAPALIGERRIGNHKVEGFECVAILEFGIGERVALHNQRSGIVMQDHVHACQTAGSRIFFLTIRA